MLLNERLVFIYHVSDQIQHIKSLLDFLVRMKYDVEDEKKHCQNLDEFVSPIVRLLSHFCLYNPKDYQYKPLKKEIIEMVNECLRSVASFY